CAPRRFPTTWRLSATPPMDIRAFRDGAPNPQPPSWPSTTTSKRSPPMVRRGASTRLTRARSRGRWSANASTPCCFAISRRFARTCNYSSQSRSCAGRVRVRRSPRSARGSTPRSPRPTSRDQKAAECRTSNAERKTQTFYVLHSAFYIDFITLSSPDLVAADASGGRGIVPILAPRRMIEVDDRVPVVGNHGVVEDDRSNPPPVPKRAALVRRGPRRLSLIGDVNRELQRPLRRGIAAVENLRHDFVSEIEVGARDAG